MKVYSDSDFNGPATTRVVCVPQVRVTQELKQTHAEQLSRLHVKHQTEGDLLEDLR